MNFFGVKRVAPSSTLKMRKSHKKSARVYAYTHAYTQIREGGGKSAPPRVFEEPKKAGSNRVNDHTKLSQVLILKWLLITSWGRIPGLMHK